MYCKCSIERVHVVLTHMNVCISVWGMCMYECVCVCVCAYVCVCICVCVHTCVHVCVLDGEGSWVFAG